MSLILNMILHLSQCLSEVDLEAIKATLKDVSFHDGLSTAGRAALQVKQNQQADMAEISGILKLFKKPKFLFLARAISFLYLFK